MTDPDARYKKVTLSRHQIERLAVFLALQRNVESVTIEETNESGFGASHAAIYHGHDDLVDDITDVGNW
jgi:hypothetical protein